MIGKLYRQVRKGKFLDGEKQLKIDSESLVP